MSGRDATRIPLEPDPKRSEEERKRRESLASEFYSCFTQYPHVLAEIRRMGGEGLPVLCLKGDGSVDPHKTLGRAGARDLVTLIDGMVLAGRLGSEEKIPGGRLQRDAKAEL